MTEQWKPVVGWEGLYEVSSEGRVRSRRREVAGGGGSRAVRGGRVLNPSPTNGYLHVTLSNASRRQSKRVHVLVLEAFRGTRPEGFHGCHRDGNASHNALSNLYWGTPTENARDREVHGTSRFALRRGACIHGHTYTAENTYLNRNGTPTCRTCRREGMRKAGAR